MRERSELNKIAAGIISGEVFTTNDIDDLNDIKVTFPGILKLTLGDALEMLNRDVHSIYQWNSKKVDGVFVDWEELTTEEWKYIKSVVNSSPPKPKNPKRKRRPWRHGNTKSQKNQRA